jgi:TfoX/Sxy family transcriptional regulator of competence genes
MASTEEKINFIVDQISGAGDIRSRKMFGEYCIYCNDKVVALVCDNKLFVKITDISKDYLDETYHAPAYPGAKNSLLIPEEKILDKAWITSLISDTESRVPKNKKKITSNK